MRLNKHILLILVVIIAAGGASALATLAARNQDQPKGIEASNKALKGRAAKQVDDENTPIVEYEQESSGMVKTPNRHLKNSKHDNERWVVEGLDGRVSEVVDESEWTIGLSDLPVDKSDLVVEGQVIGAEAFLSNDRTGVYSEFSIQVSGVLKNSTGEAINLNDTVVMERMGGKVKYKPGRVIRYRIQGQGSPIRGQMYVFFLRKIDQNSYHLLTAYQFQGESVLALDGSRINVRGQGDWVFDKHNGADLQVFRQKAQDAIKKSQ